MTTFFGVKIQKPQPLVDAIRSVVAAKRRPVAARDRVYASEISGCDRRITFALLGCEPDAPRADSPSALLGDALESRRVHRSDQRLCGADGRADRRRIAGQ